MKIALIDETHAHREKSGIGRYTYKLFRELRRASDAELLALTNEVLPEEEGAKSIPYGIWSPFLKRTINWQFHYPRVLPEGYDIYHATNPFLIKTVAGRKGSVVTVHDMGLFDLKEHTLMGERSPYFLFSMIHRKALKKRIGLVDRIIAISEFTKKRIIEILKIDGKKIDVIYHGVSPLFSPADKKEAREKLGLPADKKILLYVGTEHPKKNVNILLEAVAELKKEISDILLLRVGNCSKKSRKTISRFGLEKNVIYRSGIPEKEIVTYYNASDIFVFPSFYEGFGMPLLEAMASGIPVIAADASCFPEIAGDAGMSFDPYSPIDLADKVMSVLADNNMYEKMREKGLKRAAGFRWEKTAADTLKTYERAINE